MRILFYINVLNGGGAERVIANLANAFSDGHEIIVLNTYKTENEYVLKENVTHDYLEKEILQGNVIVRNYKRIKNLRGKIKYYNPDIAISFMAEPNIRLLLSTVGLKNKLLVSVRNDPKIEYKTSLTRFLMKLLCLRVDGIVFQTTDAKNYFPTYMQKKSKIIYNPVKKDFYENSYSVNEKNNIVSVGRLTKQKNFLFLIRSFALIKDECKDNLYIYGDGEMKDDLIKLIESYKLQDRVFLMGNSSNLPTVLQNYKLFILPSDFEGMPNALMEAMATGLPCISTDCPCGGPKELLDSDCLVEIRNEKELSNKILSFSNDYKMLDLLSNKNKLTAKTFHEDNVVKIWMDFITSIVED